MYKKIAIAGVTAAVIIGAGTAALAESGTTGGAPAVAGASSAVSMQQPTGKHRGALGTLARRVLHGQFVVSGKDNAVVTHDVIRGEVTAVSPSSITIKAADNTVQTFVVNSSTKVRIRSNGEGAPGSISQVAVRDDAVVLGVGTGPFTAMHIIDVKA